MSFFSISHVYQSALSLSTALHPLPTQLHPVIKEPMGTRMLIVRPGISTPWCRADLLTPVPLPSTHHSSSLSPLQHTLDECNSYESGSVLLTCLIQPQAVLSLICHKPQVKHVGDEWTPVAFQWVPAWWAHMTNNLWVCSVNDIHYVFVIRLKSWCMKTSDNNI